MRVGNRVLKALHRLVFVLGGWGFSVSPKLEEKTPSPSKVGKSASGVPPGKDGLRTRRLTDEFFLRM